MNTTAVMAEMIVIGFFASIWMGLLLLRMLGISPGHVVGCLPTLEPWATFLAACALIVWYQLGWIMDGLCYRLIQIPLRRRLRDPIFARDGVQHDVVRATVYASGSTPMCEELAVDRNVLRMARAAVLNFFMLAIVLPLHGWRFLGLSGVAFVFAAAAVHQWYRRYIRTHERILSFYKVLTKQSDTESSTDRL